MSCFHDWPLIDMTRCDSWYFFFFSTVEFMKHLPVQMSEHIAVQTQYEFQTFSNMVLGFSENNF